LSGQASHLPRVIRKPDATCEVAAGQCGIRDQILAAKPDMHTPCSLDYATKLNGARDGPSVEGVVEVATGDAQSDHDAVTNSDGLAVEALL